MVEEIPKNLERHAVSILTVVIVALIIWVGNSVQQAQVQLAAVQVELTHIKNNMSNDRNKFEKIENRLDSIERELRSLQDEKRARTN